MKAPAPTIAEIEASPWHAECLARIEATHPPARYFAVELFPCSGGMAEGFRRAGLTFSVAFDKDGDACDSYERNLGHRPVQIDVRDLLRMARMGWRPGWPQARDVYQEIDLLVADPPCTPWSRAGKRLGTEDERDMLRDTAELIALLRPRAYLIGNVPGLQDATQWHVVQDVIGGLVRHGYCVADYVQLDAADYGVPQHRVRPFWYGHLEGPCIRWPEPTHGAPGGHPVLPGMRALDPWVTCRQALGHLSGADLGRPVRLKLREAGEWSNGGDRSMMSHADEPAKVVGAHDTARGGQQLVAEMTHFPQHHAQSEADRPARSLSANTHGDGSVVRGLVAGHEVRGNSRHPPADPDAPAGTVGAKYRGQSEVLLTDGHPAAIADAPAPTIRGGGEGHSAPAAVLMAPKSGAAGGNHPMSAPDEPSKTITGSAGGGVEGARAMALPDSWRGSLPQSQKPSDPNDASKTIVASRATSCPMGWPWDQPSTSVLRDERLPPAGRHDRDWKDENGNRARSGPNAVILSERAAAILQGFPEGWHFAGKTKKSRWSQLGQAMPPGLAHPVAAAVLEQMARAGAAKVAG